MSQWAFENPWPFTVLIIVICLTVVSIARNWMKARQWKVPSGPNAFERLANFVDQVKAKQKEEGEK